MSTATVFNSTRYDFLDWLRVLAIFVLVFYHTGMIFVGWGWHIENAQTISWLPIPMDIAHRLRMPLLFVISGSGLWFAMNQRRGVDVLRERSKRLLLPLLAGSFLIVPPQLYFERLFRNQWHGGYLDFYVQRVLQFQVYPQGNLSWHHLWFIAYLFAYVILLLPLLLWWRRRGTHVRPGAWLYLLAIPLGVNEAVLKPLFPEAHNLVSDWYLFNHYLLFTVYGFALASIDGVWEWIAAQRHRLLGYATICLAILLALYHWNVLTVESIVKGSAIDSILANVFTWLMLLAFIGYGRAHLSFQNGLIRWARDASYPIYILHQTLIVTIGFFVIAQPWSTGVKFWAIVCGTLIACVMLYEFGIRRFAITRVIFGMKANATVPRTTLKKAAPRMEIGDTQ